MTLPAKIAMRKSASVSGLQRPRDLGCGAGSFAWAEPAVARQERGQIGPVDILGDRYVPCRPCRSHRRQRRSRGRGRPRSGIATGSRHEVGVAGVFGPQQLQSDLSVQLDVVGTVDRGEAALAEQFHEPIAAPDYLSDLGHESPLWAGGATPLDASRPCSPAPSCATGWSTQVERLQVLSELASDVRPLERQLYRRFEPAHRGPASYRTPSKA